MKVLVFAHRLELGGTQTNAIELAATGRDRFGHDVVLFATPGPASALAADKGLRLIEAPATTRHPSMRMARALRRAVRLEEPDVVHVWDWPQCLDAYFGVYLDQRVPMVCTAMGMVVPRFLPRHLLTTFGTPQLQAEAARTRPGSAFLLEPPVDLDANHPDAVHGHAFRHELGIDDDHLVVVAVSRLTEWLKLEGLQRLIDAAGLLADEVPIDVVIVGEGPARERLLERAAEVNRAVGREAVHLPGPLIDPRPAYAGADVVASMGSSALRALAFGRPVVVLGEQGFSEVFEPDTADQFFWQGFYGLGNGDPSPVSLANQLRGLLTSDERRRELGQFARAAVVSRYGLDAGAARVDALYRQARGAAPSRAVVMGDGLRTVGIRWGSSVVPEPIKQVMKQVIRQPMKQTVKQSIKHTVRRAGRYA